MKFDLLRLIDILGTISFAVSGVFAAMQKKLDLFGVLVIAFITAAGGGTLRDIQVMEDTGGAGDSRETVVRRP